MHGHVDPTRDHVWVSIYITGSLLGLFELDQTITSDDCDAVPNKIKSPCFIGKFDVGMEGVVSTAERGRSLCS